MGAEFSERVNGAPVSPHSLDAEKAVLGAILINNHAFNQAAEVIDAQDFFRDAHRRIFEKMVGLSDRSEPVDLVTLKDELGRSGELDEVGGPAYIASLTDGVPRSANVAHYARIVKEKAALRHLITSGKRIVSEAYDQRCAAVTIAETGQAELLSVVSAAPSGGVPAGSIRFTTAAELSKAEPVTTAWFVPGFVAPGVLTELGGKLKASGKTTFMGHAVAAVLDGGPFLGQPTTRTAVLWLTEERPTTFQETLKRAGLRDRSDLHILHFHDIKGRPWPAVMRECVRHAHDVGAGLLIVDTVSQFAGLRGDAENNSGSALEAVAPLQEAAAEGLAVVALRHERKGGGEVGESGRGSSAFSGAVDIVVAIRRGEGQTKPTVRVLHTLSRFTETPDTLVIDLTERGYVALGTAGTVAVLEAERALLDRLPTTEAGALALDGILEGHEPRIARTVAQEALRKLADAAVVRRIGNGKRGSPYRYFRAIEVSAGTQITGCGRNQELDDDDANRLDPWANSPRPPGSLEAADRVVARIAARRGGRS